MSAVTLGAVPAPLRRALWLAVMRSIARLDLWWIVAVPRVSLWLGRAYDGAFRRAMTAEREMRWREN